MSQLLSIIQRLQTMQNGDQHENAPQRLFEVNGKLLCQVKYFPASKTYEVEEFDKNNGKQTYQFDDIDIAAIEIFDMVQDEREQHTAE